jgi:hypothetical protein
MSRFKHLVGFPLPREGFEHTTSVFEWSNTVHALDSSGIVDIIIIIIIIIISSLFS